MYRYTIKQRSAEKRTIFDIFSLPGDDSRAIAIVTMPFRTLGTTIRSVSIGKYIELE